MHIPHGCTPRLILLSVSSREQGEWVINLPNTKHINPIPLEMPGKNHSTKTAAAVSDRP